MQIQQTKFHGSQRLYQSLHILIINFPEALSSKFTSNNKKIIRKLFPEVRTQVQGLAAKGTQPELQRAYAGDNPGLIPQQHLVQIYTDGCAKMLLGFEAVVSLLS